MEVTVKLFAAEARAVGRSEVTVELAGEPSCDRLRAVLAELYPPIEPLLGSARFAVNSEFVGPEHVIQPGDEVALIGMVSGG